jgi:hypothetical protein
MHLKSPSFGFTVVYSPQPGTNHGGLQTISERPQTKLSIAIAIRLLLNNTTTLIVQNIIFGNA